MVYCTAKQGESVAVMVVQSMVRVPTPENRVDWWKRVVPLKSGESDGRLRMVRME